ncbi:MAG: DEAD/DEAH box helicase [Caldilineaceae bacterium]|nr:DEAD/DEAH box helicase [Caldilineaceae bacterium]
MALSDLLGELRGDAQFMANVAAWRTQPALPPRFGEYPAGLHPALQSALHQRGIDRLYRHQAEAVQAALDGRDIAVVTPTASGKTLCYNLPTLHALLAEPEARALYLFPTKALAQDQLAELAQWRRVLAGGPSLRHATYDGDTPSASRSEIRQNANLILTNPDMLHTGILPYHTQWAAFWLGCASW